MEQQQEFLANRQQWRSQFSFIIVTAGAVIGISNFWQFPNLVANYGGGAFLIMYLAATILIGIPAMFSEMLIGRAGRQNQVSSLHLLAMTSGVSRSWRFLGWWTAAALFLIASFYCVIACISLDYLTRFSIGAFASASPTNQLYNLPSILANSHELLLWNAVFIAIVTLVVMRGIRRGLERISYIAIGVLFFVLFVMLFESFGTHEFSAAWANLVHVDPAAFTLKGFLVALNYAFFTLSLGVGSMLVYGSYLPARANLSRSILSVIFLDMLVAVLAYLAISPWMGGQWENATGLEALYGFLPRHITTLRYFHLQGLMFYLMVFLAAWTAAISLFEPLVIIMNERFKMSRRLAAMVIAAFVWLLGLGTVFSFNIWQHVYLYRNWNFFGVISTLSAEFMMPIGSIGFCIFAGWRLNRAITTSELEADRYPITYAVWRFLARYVAPFGILAVIFW